MALDTQPHPGATGSAMLGNLANMAAREVDAPFVHQQIPQEFYNDGVPVGPRYRKLIDDYIWVTFMLDTTKPGWRIQHANAAFHGMTGNRLEAFLTRCTCIWEILPEKNVSPTCLT